MQLHRAMSRYPDGNVKISGVGGPTGRTSMAGWVLDTHATDCEKDPVVDVFKTT